MFCFVFLFAHSDQIWKKKNKLAHNADTPTHTCRLAPGRSVISSSLLLSDHPFCSCWTKGLFRAVTLPWQKKKKNPGFNSSAPDADRLDPQEQVGDPLSGYSVKLHNRCKWLSESASLVREWLFFIVSECLCSLVLSWRFFSTIADCKL